MNQGVPFLFPAKIPSAMRFQIRPVFWIPPPWEFPKWAHWKLGGFFFGIRGKLWQREGGGVPPGNWEFLDIFNQKWENNSGVTTTQRAAL